MIAESDKSKTKNPKYKALPFVLPASSIQAGIINSGNDHSTRLDHLANLFVKGGAKVAVITDEHGQHGASTYNISYSELPELYHCALCPYIGLTKKDANLIKLTHLLFGQLIYPDQPFPEKEKELLAGAIFRAFEEHGHALEIAEIADMLLHYPGSHLFWDSLTRYFPRRRYTFCHNTFTIRPFATTFNLKGFQKASPVIRGFALLLVLFQVYRKIITAQDQKKQVIIIENLWIDLLPGAGKEFLTFLSNQLRESGGFLFLTASSSSAFNRPEVVSFAASALETLTCLHQSADELIHLDPVLRQLAKEDYIHRTLPEGAKLIGPVRICFECHARPLNEYYESASLGLNFCPRCYDFKKRLSFVTETSSSVPGTGFELISSPSGDKTPALIAQRLLKQVSRSFKRPKIDKELYLYLNQYGEEADLTVTKCFRCEDRHSGTFVHLKNRPDYPFCNRCVQEEIKELDHYYSRYRSRATNLFGLAWLMTHNSTYRDETLGLNLGFVPLTDEKESQIQEMALAAPSCLLVATRPVTFQLYPMLEDRANIISIGPGYFNPFPRLDFIDSSRMIALTAIIGQMIRPDRPLHDDETAALSALIHKVCKKHQKRTSFSLIANELVSQPDPLAQSLGSSLSDFLSVQGRQALLEGKRIIPPNRRINIISLHALGVDSTLQRTALLLTLFEHLSDRPDLSEDSYYRDSHLFILDGVTSLLKALPCPELVSLLFRNAKENEHSIIQISDAEKDFESLPIPIRKELNSIISARRKTKLLGQLKEVIFSNYLEQKFLEKQLRKDLNSAKYEEDWILAQQTDTLWEIRQTELIALAIREYHKEETWRK